MPPVRSMHAKNETVCASLMNWISLDICCSCEFSICARSCSVRRWLACNVLRASPVCGRMHANAFCTNENWKIICAISSSITNIMQYNVLASLRQVSLCQYETRYILISTTSFFNHFQYPIFAKCTALCACCTRIRIVHNRLTEFVVRISFNFIRSFQFASDGRHTRLKWLVGWVGEWMYEMVISSGRSTAVGAQ